jgi:gas vesicle protein
MADDENDLETTAEQQGGEGAGAGIGGFVAGVLFGALLGAGMALLFAPDRGAKVRRRLGHRLHDLREEAADAWDDASRRARKELVRRRKRLGLS